MSPGRFATAVAILGFAVCAHAAPSRATADTDRKAIAASARASIGWALDKDKDALRLGPYGLVLRHARRPRGVGRGPDGLGRRALDGVLQKRAAMSAVAPRRDKEGLMKMIGMVGGTGWVSTLEYYRLLNEEVNRRLGGHEAARCLVYSLNFGDVMRIKAEDPEQGGVRTLVVDAARVLAGAGAELLLLCANTIHWFADDVERAVAVPLVHIAAATGRRIRAQGLTRVGLLGTRPTMERDFYTGRLAEGGVSALVPEADDRAWVDATILDELVRKVLRPEARERFLGIIDGLRRRGAEGIVLGCTEIPLLIKPGDVDLPLFDTLSIHAEAAVDRALE
jgi:aspartate racemase